nr:slime protein [Eoperipatus sp.]
MLGKTILILLSFCLFIERSYSFMCRCEKLYRRDMVDGKLVVTEINLCPKTVTEKDCPRGLVRNGCGCCPECGKDLGQSCSNAMLGPGKCGTGLECVGWEEGNMENTIKAGVCQLKK